MSRRWDDERPVYRGTRNYEGASSGIGDAIGDAFIGVLEASLGEVPQVASAVAEQVVAGVRRRLTPDGSHAFETAFIKALYSWKKQGGSLSKLPKAPKVPKAAKAPRAPKAPKPPPKPKGPKAKPAVQRAALEVLAQCGWDVFDAMEGADAGKGQKKAKLSSEHLKQRRSCVLLGLTRGRTGCQIGKHAANTRG